MDHLTITSSLTGLTSTAAHLTSTLHSFTTNLPTTPTLVINIMSEVRAISSVLSNLQGFLWGDTRSSKLREAMITVEQLIVTLSGCVHTFSELQKEVGGLRCEYDVGAMNVLKWYARERVINGIFERLKGYKSVLNLMLTILESELQEDADKSQEKLCTLITQQLETQKDMTTRLRKLEATIAQSPRNPNPLPRASYPSTLPRQTTPNPESFDFDADLQLSRVYKRSFWKPWRLGSIRESRIYPATGRSTGWSYLSGMSLADVSNISTLSLPVYAFDISNSECYSFESTLVEVLDDTRSETTSIVLSPPTPTPTSPKPAPVPHLGHLLQQTKSIAWQSSAKEPHPNLSLSNNPKELEVFLNELWASAYDFDYDKTDGSDTSSIDDSIIEKEEKEEEEKVDMGDGDDDTYTNDSDSSHTSYGSAVLEKLIGWAR